MRLQRSNIIFLTLALLLPMLLVFTTISTLRPAFGDGIVHSASNTPSTSVIPRDPPRADKISFSSLNGLGEATVTGAPGAVLPDAHVLLVNLNTSHQDHVISNPDGSFSARIFAPPGSAIMVKHGPDHRLGKHEDDPWRDVDQGARGMLSIFPSTTIYRPHEHAAGPDAVPFATAGATDVSEEPSSIGAGWSMIGTVSPANDLQAGDTVHVEATLQLYSRAIVSATDVSSITLQIDEVTPWLMLYDGAGNPLPHVNLAGSNRLTPTGFPVLDSNRPDVWTRVQWQPVNWQFVGDHVAEGTLAMDMFLDADMPPGIYRPILNLRFTGVPSDTVWPAALLSWMAGMPSFKNDSSGAALPPLEVEAPAGGNPEAGDTTRHLVWYLQMDNASLGTRGSGAVQDRDIFQPASFVATQGAPYVLPLVDAYSGEPATYRLEPYLPMISYGRDAAPGPPLIPFILPGGQLCVTVQEPDGHREELGCEPFAQSVSGNKTTALGEGLNAGAIEITEYYGLTSASGRFVVTFTKPGYHLVEMSGWIEDVWGNRYEGGGTYEVWVAYPIDIDPGLLPGTPLAVGDAVNPTVQLNPRLPAYVNLTFQYFPYSDPGLMDTYNTEGWANRFGHFTPDGPPITLDQPGEYRLDLFAEYVDPETGEVYAAAATWGGVVMTPPGQTQLVAHGRRGSDNHSAIPGQWFLFCDPQLQPPLVDDSTPHLLNPYLNGDILWSFDIYIHDNPECLGDALMMNASVQDTVGSVETAITERYNRAVYPMTVAHPGSFEQRAQAGALPLFSSTTSGRVVSLYPEETDQIAYAYLSSQRPGVRVRETVAEDRQGSGYWRLDSMYDNQPGAGVEGDLPNDFKFQFVGAVYRDLESGLSEYLGQGSGWVHLPYEDTTGSRVMPPFSGPGNGGWPTDGGPLMTLKGEDIHMFILPTGVRPGAVLQVGDRFDFGGHLMPTLDSQVLVEVTSPSGQTHLIAGQANPTGYFYAPWHSFVVDEPGRWTVFVQVWHDGKIGSGEQVNCDAADPFDPLLPCPSGDVLGSADGRYAFYVVPPESPRLVVTAPAPGRLTFEQGVAPIEISGPIPAGITNATVDYTISMPGFILNEGQAQIENGSFSLTFDPVALHDDFPNLDLTSRHGWVPGLADTFSFGLLLSGEQEGEPVYRATTLTIQGDQVYVENAEDVVIFHDVYLPVVLATGAEEGPGSARDNLAASGDAAHVKRSSSAIAITGDGQTLLVVNPDSGSLSIVDLNGPPTVTEVSVGADPRTVTVSDDGARAYTANHAGNSVSVVDLGTRQVIGEIDVGARPYGVVVSPDGRFLYVAEQGHDRLTVVDTATLTKTMTVPLPDRPSGLAISEDGHELYITHLLSKYVTKLGIPIRRTYLPIVIQSNQAGQRTLLESQRFVPYRRAPASAIPLWPDSNLVQSIVIDPYGERAYVPHTRSNSSNPALTLDTTVFPLVSVIDLTTGQHLAGQQFNLDVLDPPAVGLPFDAAFTPGGAELWVLNAASNDVTVIDLETRQRVAHIEVGDNPRGVVIHPDGHTAYVNNTLAGSVSVIDTAAYTVTNVIPVTSIPLDPVLLTGKRLFHGSDDPRMGKDQWMSCNSCHFDGEHDGQTWLLGFAGPRNTTSLLGMGDTLPLRWSGEWDEAADSEFAIRMDSFGTGLVEGEMHCSLDPPDCVNHPPHAGVSADLDALAAYISSLIVPLSPGHTEGQPLSEAAQRGEVLFEDPAIGCAVCHPPPLYTDNLIHDVGTATADERIGPAFNTPSLRGIYDTPPYFHDGSAATLYEIVTRPSDGSEHDVSGMLNEAEIQDLVAFLWSLPYEN